MKNDDIHLNEWVIDTRTIQDHVIQVAQQLQHQHEEIHLKDNSSVEVTEYDIDSYVLVAYPITNFGQRRPNKFSMYYRGPYKVHGKEGNKYTLENLVTGKLITVLIHLLKTILL